SYADPKGLGADVVNDCINSRTPIVAVRSSAIEEGVVTGKAKKVIVKTSANQQVIAVQYEIESPLVVATQKKGSEQPRVRAGIADIDLEQQRGIGGGRKNIR